MIYCLFEDLYCVSVLFAVITLWYFLTLIWVLFSSLVELKSTCIAVSCEISKHPWGFLEVS